MTEEDFEEQDIQNCPKLIKLSDYSSLHKYIFRICLLGDSGVGKTSLLTRYSEGKIIEKYNSTIGVDFKVVTLKLNDVISKVHIWDTAGQERFKSIAINYFRNSHGFIFVYDISNRESFENLNNWIELAFSNNQNSIINFLIGNKSDLNETRKVSTEEGLNFYNDYKFNLFCESSAKTGHNISKIFIKAGFILYDDYLNNLNECDSTENESIHINDKNSFNSINSKQKRNCC
jgi:Ras-related protein Rab-1A